MRTNSSAVSIRLDQHKRRSCSRYRSLPHLATVRKLFPHASLERFLHFHSYRQCRNQHVLVQRRRFVGLEQSRRRG